MGEGNKRDAFKDVAFIAGKKVVHTQHFVAFI